MNAKERRANLVAELKGLVDGVKAGDSEAMTRSDELVAELDKVDSLLEKAAEKATTLEKLGQTSEKSIMKGAQKMSEKNYTELLKEALDNAGEKGSVSVEMKAAGDTVVRPNPGVVDYQDRIVAVPNGRLGVRDLLPTEQVSNGTFAFFQVTHEGEPGVVAEDGAKPQVHSVSTLVTTSTKTIGAVEKITDEMRADYPRLVSVIQNRLVYAYDRAEEKQIVADLIATTGIQSTSDDSSPEGHAKSIFHAIMMIKDATGLDADAVLISPNTYEKLRLAQDANKQFFGGGMFQGAYGNGGTEIYPRLWGLKVVVTPDLTDDNIYVGAFNEGAAYAVRGPREITVGLDGADFSHDRSTVRIAGRGVLEVFVPAAFVHIYSV